MNTAQAEAYTGFAISSPYERLTAASIIGQPVTNQFDEVMGVVENLMINIHTGRIEYVVLRFEGFFGFGGKLFAVPFRKLTYSTEKRAFLVERRRAEFENMPGFDKDHWPYTNSHSFKDLEMLWNSKAILQT